MEFKSYKDLPPATMTLENSLSNKTGSWRTFRPILDPEKCIKCYICWKFCPEPCIEISDDELPVFDYDYCKGCGICANECPKDAIEMILEEWK